MFTFKLGENVAVGDLVLVSGKWETVIAKSEEGVVFKSGTELSYGDGIGGWKAG